MLGQPVALMFGGQMNIVSIILLAVVQGAAELLPVSSSAHVIVAEKLLGFDPSAPEMTFLLVMLHTGTMFAVLVHYWPMWRSIWQQSLPGASREIFVKAICIATICTGVIGFGLKIVIERLVLKEDPNAEIEQLFKSLPLMATSLIAVGFLIIIAGRRSSRAEDVASLTPAKAGIIGAVQGLCLPFRGFSRSGATISTAMLIRIPKELAETFSFALAVVLTPPVIAIEGHRLLKASKAGGGWMFASELFGPGVAGMVCSFLAGLVALRWLSRWLEKGKWYLFGYYCLAAGVAVAFLHTHGL